LIGSALGIVPYARPRRRGRFLRKLQPLALCGAIVLVPLLSLWTWRRPLSHAVSSILVLPPAARAVGKEHGPGLGSGCYLVDIHDLVPRPYVEPRGPEFEHPGSEQAFTEYNRRLQSRISQILDEVASACGGTITEDRGAIRFNGTSEQIKPTPEGADLLVVGTPLLASKVANVINGIRLRRRIELSWKHLTGG